MADPRSNPEQSVSRPEVSPLPELPSPGLLGRSMRLALGLAMLAFLYPLLTVWRTDMWAGRLPLDDAAFYVLAGLALWVTSYVFNIMIRAQFGQRTLAVVLLGAASAGAAGYALEGAFPNIAFGAYLWVWFGLLCGLLGPAHLLAAALGTPGCEMRSYAHLRARLRGGDVGEVVCPGGIDRFDHIRPLARGASAREEGGTS